MTDLITNHGKPADHAYFEEIIGAYFKIPEDARSTNDQTIRSIFAYNLEAIIGDNNCDICGISPIVQVRMRVRRAPKGFNMNCFGLCAEHKGNKYKGKYLTWDVDNKYKGKYLTWDVDKDTTTVGFRTVTLKTWLDRTVGQN